MPAEQFTGVVERSFIVSSPHDPAQPFGACVIAEDGRRFLVEGLHVRVPAEATLTAERAKARLTDGHLWLAIRWEAPPCTL